MRIRHSPPGSHLARRLIAIGRLASLILVGFAPSASAAQNSSTSHVGVSGIAALGALVGGEVVEGKSHAGEVGAFMDLGWVRTPRLRLQGEVEFLRARLRQYVLVQDTTFDGPFFDLSATVSAVLLGGNEHQRFVPYLDGGVGVHALSSTFGTLVLDRLYNANPFGFHVGAGARVWTSGSGRNGMFVEVRRVIAEAVNRSSVRVGGMVFYRDLIRPKR